MHKISIIIPTKNEEKLILSTMNNILPLKKKYGIEIIISDGGSTDRTLKLAGKHADRVTVLNTKHTIGRARNLGASKAGGEILLFMDADVRVDEKIFAELEKKFWNPWIVGVTAPIDIYPEQAKFPDKVFHWFLNLLVRINWFLGIGGARGEFQAVRRDAFNKIKGYKEDLAASEDFDLFMRLRKVGKISILKTHAYESPRRYRKYGYARVLWLYLVNYLSNLLLHRSYSKNWESVR